MGEIETSRSVVLKQLREAGVRQSPRIPEGGGVRFSSSLPSPLLSGRSEASLCPWPSLSTTLPARTGCFFRRKMEDIAVLRRVELEPRPPLPRTPTHTRSQPALSVCWWVAQAEPRPVGARGPHLTRRGEAEEGRAGGKHSTFRGFDKTAADWPSAEPGETSPCRTRQPRCLRSRAPAPCPPSSASCGRWWATRAQTT